MLRLFAECFYASAVRDARRESFDFLGYSFGPHCYRKDGHGIGASPSKKSVLRLKARLTSDAGAMLLALADRRLGLAEKLSHVFPDGRDPSRIVQGLADMIRARVFAIACGYEDGNDLDRLAGDPAFKLACGRLPDTDRDLCSQPTLSRLENAPRLREAIRLTYAGMDSYPHTPSAITLDIDDTVDVVHGRQQLSLFNAYYDPADPHL